MDAVSEINRDHLRRLIELAREEDFGIQGDITSRLASIEPNERITTWRLAARKEGRFCGEAILSELLRVLAPRVQVAEMPVKDGEAVQPDRCIAVLRGPAGEMLAAERIILNFLQHLSGVATMTARFVAAVSGTNAKIFDTRKTTPGMRSLEKYAVRCGGGCNHRRGLYDAVMIKDNHLAGVPMNRLAHTVFEMLNGVAALPARPSFVEVECDGLDPLGELLKVVGIDVILLDNFEMDEMRRAVRMRDDAGLRGKLELEASGGIALERVRPIAETGVERISVGAITHSAPILDLGLDAE